MSTRASVSERDAQKQFHSELLACLPLLRSRALKLCLNATEAEDLVQDTLERALRFQSTFQPGTNLGAWSRQVLFSVFVSRCRKRGRERRALEGFRTDPNAWSRATSQQTAEALPTRLSHLFEELPEKFRSVLHLVDLEELSYREAAEELDVRIGTVMSRLFRGRKQLALRLEPTSIKANETARAA